VNALSKELVASVKRDGFHWEQRFQQGVPQGPAKKLGPARGSGTSVWFRPDATIFPRIEFDADVIAARLEVASYLHRGLQITFDIQVAGHKITYAHDHGLVDYLTRITTERGAKPVHEAPFVLAKDNGLRLDLVLQWTESTDEHLRSYVNG